MQRQWDDAHRARVAVCVGLRAAIDGSDGMRFGAHDDADH